MLESVRSSFEVVSAPSFSSSFLYFVDDDGSKQPSLNQLSPNAPCIAYFSRHALFSGVRIQLSYRHPYCCCCCCCHWWWFFSCWWSLSVSEYWTRRRALTTTKDADDDDDDDDDWKPPPRQRPPPHEW